MNIDLLNFEEVGQLLALIEESAHIVICAHRSPDGDALGSSLGLAGYLRSQGKEPVVCVPDMFPDFLQWLPGAQAIMRFDKRPDEVRKLMAEADLIFCLDFGQPDRLGDMATALTESPAPRVVIDHHPSPEMDSVLMVNRPQMSSTSEMVFRVIWQMGGFEQLTQQDAACIYCGMMTDTGAFTYNSSRPEIFIIIGQLLTKHIDKDKIYRNVYNNFSAWAIRLRGYLMSQKLNVFEDVHAAYFTISRQDMRRFHFIKGDAEGLVNEPLRIKGMKLSVSLREDDRRDNLVWVSLRSVGQFPCNEVAERFFNGGGHLNASGGRLLCSLEEAEKTVRQAFAEYAEILKKG